MKAKHKIVILLSKRRSETGLVSVPGGVGSFSHVFGRGLVCAISGPYAFV